MVGNKEWTSEEVQFPKLRGYECVSYENTGRIHNPLRFRIRWKKLVFKPRLWPLRLFKREWVYGDLFGSAYVRWMDTGVYGSHCVIMSCQDWNSFAEIRGIRKWRLRGINDEN